MRTLHTRGPVDFRLLALPRPFVCKGVLRVNMVTCERCSRTLLTPTWRRPYEIRIAIRNGNPAAVERAERVQRVLGSARADRTRRSNRDRLRVGGRASLP